MIVFRHADTRYPFFWEDAAQRPARWHGAGEGPVQYLADTPDGAWAEFLRHEEIVDPADLAGIRRALWAVELPEPPVAEPRLPDPVLRGGEESYTQCQEEARRLRRSGAEGLRAPSAALEPGAAGGYVTDRGLQRGPHRNGVVFVLFGPRPDLVAWQAVPAGSPGPELLPAVRPLTTRG